MIVGFAFLFELQMRWISNDCYTGYCYIGCGDAVVGQQFCRKLGKAIIERADMGKYLYIMNSDSTDNILLDGQTKIGHLDKGWNSGKGYKKAIDGLQDLIIRLGYHL